MTSEEAPTLRRAVSDTDKASRPGEILSAAKNTVAEKGYHATTIADIVKAAGPTNPKTPSSATS